MTDISMEKMKSILICEDNSDIRTMMSKVLSREGYSVTVSCSGEECLKLYKDDYFLVIVDVNLPGISGFEVLNKLRSKSGNLYIVIITAYFSIEQSVRAIRSGANNYLAKPFTNEALIAAVKEFDGKDCWVSGPENGSLFWGTRSIKMKKFYDELEKISRAEANVLIVGETGTGKEGVAKYIHERSLRKSNEFVVVDCPAIPHSLFESEMFGYHSGAFTGAKKDKVGRFERAADGTLFLDEVADIDLESQAKLLRTIQEGEFERLGASGKSRVDVRVICASSRDLGGENNPFRRDLYYRLAEVVVSVPALRDRIEDVPLLATHILEHLCRMNRRVSMTLNDRVVADLCAYNWPGNVRELRSLLHRLVILSGPDQREISEIPDEYIANESSGREKWEGYDAAMESLSLRDNEKRVILAALAKTDSNVRKAAEILGIGRTTLYRRMKKLCIKAKD